MRRYSLAAVLIASSIAASAFAADSTPGMLSPGDRDFINKAAQGGQMEVQAGKLAATRALAPQVKTFAQKMVSDHSANNDLLKSLADSKQMPLPEDVSPEQRTMLGKLEGLNGTDFDQAYTKMMVKDHTEDITEYKTEASSGKDADVKAYASQTLPTLRHHLMLANQINSQKQQ